jgi:5,6-dimethylbenzimidazole synthase
MLRTGEFSAQAKEAIYQVIHDRRDVRQEFTGEPIDSDTLTNILEAAHHAPSVGFMQPWDFIVIDDLSQREKVKSAFDIANKHGSSQMSDEKKDLYKELKLEGILESSLNLAITCDPRRHGPIQLGTTSQEKMDLYSCVCAIQNLWLAARAEGIGVGWVSIIDPKVLSEILEIPEPLEIVAYLCLGPVHTFRKKPELESVGWEKRLPLQQLIHSNKYQSK